MNWHDYFYYDETSPSCLRWKVKRKRSNPGDVAGCLTRFGYYAVGCNNKMHLVHRVCYELCVGAIPEGSKIDHVDRSPSNNRISNLRLASTAQNAMNKCHSSGSVSGFKGVSWKIDHAKWRACIEKQSAGKRISIHIGYFATAEDAARAYDAKAKELFGEFALLNFPQ